MKGYLDRENETPSKGSSTG